MFGRFNKIKIILAIISIAVACGVTFIQYNYIASREKVEMIRVATVTESVKAGCKVKNDVIAIKEIPASAFVNDMIKCDKDFKFDDVYAKIDISSGNYLLKTMVSTCEVPVIKEGMRKVAISANMTMALAGKVRSGDYVDIGYVPNKDDSIEKAQIIEKNIQICDIINNKALDIGKVEGSLNNQYDANERIPASITLIVTPEQAIRVKEFESKGSIFLLGY